MSDYAKMLRDGYAATSYSDPISRLAYLADYIFDFTTYDSEISELFAQKAIEVCSAITSGKTWDYIQDEENYRWNLIMCNMPFFADRLEWGTSIRGAWWDASPGQKIRFDSCGLWLGDKQITEMLEFNRQEWEEFIRAVLEFAEEGSQPAPQENEHGI